MNRILTAALISSLLGLAGPASLAAAAAQQDSPLVGAYALVPAESSDIQEARAFVQSRLVSLDLGKVDVAYAQVVNGTNFKFICSVLDAGQAGSWKFVAHRGLDGQWQLTVAQRL